MKSINLKSAVGIALFFILGILATVSCKKEKPVFAVADFSFSGNISNLPATVQFTNKSYGLFYTWDFGDGSTSTAENPSHTYTQYGLYKVKLTAQGTNNADSMVLDIVVGGIFPPNTVHCDPNNPTAIVDVTNPTTGKIWMDRNLGASRVATSSTDALAYGDLYQWGRRSDGHQCRTSPTTTTLSSTDQPGNGNFILAPSTPNDWRSPQNANLWQGVNGVNNPCPNGYRLPTETELNAERVSWSSNNVAGAFASPLKLPMAGYRSSSNGLLLVGIYGDYWSSTVSSAGSRSLGFNNSAVMNTYSRADGSSVRCIKN